ncbi:hypothetical protein LEP1GSC188_3406 [Leptospira weilii serovar Topaz str. LT2116]|uniref:CemA domain protein n=1 Tax=Leptospira weilii serovar Topaz str. LT2116 TaxID=1088540 RepID=M3H0B4_9LEPT|nr:hypothetical protein LEP1GSC188_3406 [Leptospira weilii serovar Topaz str. LT2116]
MRKSSSKKKQGESDHEKNALIVIFIFCYAVLFCVTPQLSPPSAVKAQAEGYKRTQDALKNNEPGASERAVSDLQSCSASLIEFDKTVKSKDEKIAELENSLRKCNEKVAKYAQGTGFQMGVEWIAGIGIVFIILLFLIYLVVTGKLKIPFVLGG